jgi:hypothetical protein
MKVMAHFASSFYSDVGEIFLQLRDIVSSLRGPTVFANTRRLERRFRYLIVGPLPLPLYLQHPDSITFRYF